MRDKYEHTRIELPLVWEPDEDWCVLVRIPGSIQHVEQLTGWIEKLAWTPTHERDATKTGAAIVARRWAAALHSQPVRVFEDCGMLDYRDKPGDPTIVQYSKDEGETWLDGWTKCAPVQFVTRTPVNTPEDAKDIAAGLIENVYREVVVTIIEHVGDGDTDEEIQDAVCAQVTAWGAVDCKPDEVQGIIDHIRTLTEEERDNYVVDCGWTDLFEEIEGHVTSAGEHWLDTWANWLYEHLNTWSDELYNTLNEWAYAIGIGPQVNAFYGAGGGGGGAEFGSDCSDEIDGYLWRVLGPYTFDVTRLTSIAQQDAQLPFDLLAGETVAATYVEYFSSPGLAGSYQTAWNGPISGGRSQFQPSVAINDYPGLNGVVWGWNSAVVIPAGYTEEQLIEHFGLDLSTVNILLANFGIADIGPGLWEIDPRITGAAGNGVHVRWRTYLIVRRTI